jgi:hypothetical protein
MPVNNIMPPQKIRSRRLVDLLTESTSNNQRLLNHSIVWAKDGGYTLQPLGVSPMARP